MRWYRIDYKDTDGETSTWYLRATSTNDAVKQFSKLTPAHIVRCVLALDYVPA